MFNQRSEVSEMSEQQFHLTPWLVVQKIADGNKTIARYRFRGDAEGHAQQLQRMLPGHFEVVFEQPRVSLR